MTVTLSSIVLGVNSAVLSFICVDYIKFRISLNKSINTEFMPRKECSILSSHIEKNLEEIKETLKRLENKIEVKNNV